MARHHLIDPITGTSARTTVLATTVVATDAWRAEVLAKAAFLADGTAAVPARAPRGGRLALTADGVRTTSTWPAFRPDPPGGRS